MARTGSYAVRPRLATAGTYENAIHVRVKWRDLVVRDLWLVRGVGLVQMEGSPYTLRLIRIERVR